MPLRRLELSNFKSYRGSQVIDFGDAPFMCIIGPNGSGKSNLMDAISFVLGVKSAQLRSTQLKDLVYRGRKAAQGQGQDDEEDMEVDEETQEIVATQDEDARTAFVIAVYEDDQAKEWKFKRSINTAGASTYYLNSRAVPWTTYNTQLEKFNILVKAKNFLVFQGDVEGVASQDSRALAKLIDRISGSLDLAQQYDAAKLAQEKAAEASNANFAKKRGMVAEVRHFEDQRTEYRQWEKLRNAKDAAVQRHLLWRLYHITTEINESTRKVEEANEKLTGLRASAEQSDKKLKEAKKDHATASLDVKKREANVKKGEKALEDKKPEIVTIETQIAHSEKRVSDLSRVMERVQKDEDRQADSLKELEQGAADIARRKDEAAEAQRKKSQAAGRSLSQADLDQYRTLRTQANTLVVTERQQLETLRREKKTLSDALASVQDKIQQAETKRTQLQTEIARLSEREEETSEKVDSLSTEADKIKIEVERAQEERMRLRQKETEINERLQDVFNKLLQAGVDKQESQRAAKLKETLSNLKRVFPGVHGRVMDLCKPTQSKYDTAVMTILGRHTDAVIVEQEKTAIDCIEYMKNQRAGSATFIPLDTIQVKAVPERLRNSVKGARLAIDCIDYDPNVERAFQHVCGNAMICDTMAIAKEVCYEKAQGVKGVTLEGTVIHRSGLITGGQSSSSNRKFDDSEVDRLKKMKDKYTSELMELGKSKPKDQRDELLLERLARLNAQLSVAQDGLKEVQSRLSDLRGELKAKSGEVDKLRPDLKSKTKAVDAIDAKVTKAEQAVNAADDGVFKAFCKKIKVANIREYEDVQLRVASEENEKMAEFVTSQNRVGHQIEFEKKQLETTRERIASLTKSIENEKTNISTRKDQKAELETEVQDLQRTLDKLRKKLNDATAVLDAASDKVEEARSAARKMQRDLDRAMKQIAGWNDEIEKSASDRHAIYRKCRMDEIEIPLVSGSMDKVPLVEAQKDDEMDIDDDGTQRPAAVDDFGVEPDFDELDEEAKDNGSEEVGRELEAEVNRMKADLEKMAPNTKAVERLKDVQSGLQEVEEEADETRKESRKARDEFLDLKKKRCDLFNKAYNHMSGCIDKVYKDLTKNKAFPQGGVAFLSLEDAEEPYLSGVKYNVMPPGKRFADMEQLSGGEKTMAALALLFAIHSFHPAPFFVLDEVDAALDPTNVAKLAAYIRSQAEKEVQFLIISLKSALYEHADGLVGVYRENEENTSKTLSLDLRKYVE